jgi:hypothetical protein
MSRVPNLAALDRGASRKDLVGSPAAMPRDPLGAGFKVRVCISALGVVVPAIAPNWGVSLRFSRERN